MISSTRAVSRLVRCATKDTRVGFSMRCVIALSSRGMTYPWPDHFACVCPGLHGIVLPPEAPLGQRRLPAGPRCAAQGLAQRARERLHTRHVAIVGRAPSV